MVYSLSKVVLFKVYKVLFKIRTLELLISEKYKYGKMRCPTHLSVGQELVPSVLSYFIKKEDYAVSTHRCHAHYVAKGGDINKMVAEIYGKESGCSKGRGGSMHLIDLKVNFMGSTAIVGNNIPIGVGLGLSSRIKNKKNISYIFFGDGAVEQGVFYESVNFSIIHKLPVIFICENNLYSVYTPLKERQPRNRKIFKMVKSLGINSLCCDGYDYKSVLSSIKKSIRYVKKYQKPFFIEFKTYRWLEHCGPNFDNELGYRTKNEFITWKKKDPLSLLRKKIVKFLGISKTNKIEDNIKKEIENAFIYAERSSFPKPIKNYNKLIYG